MEAIPIWKKCTYHYPDARNSKQTKCKNCGVDINLKGYYKDGYYQIFTMPNGQRIGFTTDTLK